jgi:hypothetical protein
MSLKTKALVGATALGVIASGVGVAAGTAHAATPPCGTACKSYVNLASGGVLDVAGARAVTGDPIIEWGASYGDRAQDFVKQHEGTVDSLLWAGLVSKSFAYNYGSLHAFELEYSPFGVGSGLCVGVAKAATAGEAVTLQPCGVSSKTIWAVDTKNSSNGYAPLINGSTTNFSHPDVAANDNGKVVLRNLNGFYGQNGIIAPNQLWEPANGVF